MAVRTLPLLLAFSLSAAAQSVVTTLVGTDWVFPNSATPAVSAPLGSLRGLALDAAGNLFASDCDNNFIVRVTPAGDLTIVAGNGILGFSPDGPASGSRLACPTYLTMAPNGELYFAEIGRIRKLTRDGRLVTVAGGGSNLSDGIPATQAGMRNPQGIAVDAAGNLYYTELDTPRIRKVGIDGLVSNFAGTGERGFSGDGGPASSARMSGPTGLVAAPDGSLYVADFGNSRIRVIAPDGVIRTIAGNGLNFNRGDGGPADVASIFSPSAIYLEPSGALLTLSSQTPELRRIAPDGIISTVSTSGLRLPRTVAASADGKIFIADSGNSRIRQIDSAGIETTIAGNGNWRRNPDPSKPLTSWLSKPRSIAISPAGLVTFTDEFEQGAIRQIDASGQLVRLAAGTPFLFARQLAFDATGNLYVTDLTTIRKFSPDGTATVVAGNASGLGGFSGDNGPATQARLFGPEGIAINAQGEIFISDTSNARIRKVDRNGIIRTIAGTGDFNFSGDGGPAVSASLTNPTQLAVDGAGNLYVSDRAGNRVRRIGTDGIISTVAGTGVPAFSGDGGPAVRASLFNPDGLAFDTTGNLYIADYLNARIRVVRPNGVISTVAGSSNFGFSGDGGAPTDAGFRGVAGVAVDSAGRIYIADTGNDRIRVVQSSSVTFSVSSSSVAFTATNAAPIEVRLSGSVNGLAYQASAATASGGNWLSVAPASGAIPAALQLTLNPAGLPPGTYAGTVTVNVPLATPATRQITVTLTVPAPQAPKLTIGSQSITFKFQLGDGSSSLGLSLGNQGGGSIPFTTSIRTTSGGNWLSASPASGAIAAGANTTLTLTATPSNLAEGTYAAVLTISDGATPVTIPVTLSITRAQGKLLLSQTGLAFTAVEGGGSPSPQTFGVLNEGSGELPFETQVTTLSGGNWLKLNSGAGRILRPLQDVSFVEVVPDTSKLIEGDYYAEIRVTSPGVSPQIVTALIKVLPRGANPGPEVRPTGLVFIGTPGSAPPSEDVRISNLVTAPTTYTSSSLTFDGGKWVSHLPAAATVSPNEPRRLVVQSDFTGITPGVKRGALFLLFEDGTSRTVNILSIVPATAPAPNKNGIREATSCSSPTLRSEFLNLSEGASLTIGQPATVEVKVADECGNLLLGTEKGANSAVFAKFSNGDPDVRMVPLGTGVWSATWRPVNPATGGVTVSAVSVFVQGLTLQAGRGDRSVRLVTGAGASAPIVRQGSLVHGASQRGDAPVAPGTLVTLYGANLASGSDSTEVLLAGQALPLLFTSANQINAQVPYNLQVNTQHQVVVRRGATLSVPESFTVAAAQPGIFTANQQGTGQGIVMGPDQVSVAAPDKPAQRGQAIIIYCTGLGAVTPNVALGQPAPGNPLATVTGAVNVNAGDKPAQVLFAGLTPGFTGLYQVNAVLSADTPPGDAVPLTITASGQTSNTVTIAVR